MSGGKNTGATVGATIISSNKNIQKQSGDERETSKSLADPFSALYGEGVIEPPFSPYDLAALVNMSNTLPQCVQAMEQNCEGYGYNLIPLVTDEEKKDEKIAAAVEEEKERLVNFFTYASYDMSFTKLRKKVRKDLEGLGNGYMEVLRNGKGVLDGFDYLKGITMRLGPLSRMINVKVFKREPGSREYVQVDYRKRFRTYVQIVGADKVYFKELGDPRNINCATGKEVTKEEIENAKEKGQEIFLANELIHFLLEDHVTPYGIPRWIGTSVSVAGSRNAEEVNNDYFNNKTIPPMILMISGGTLSKGSKEVVREFIEHDVKGKDNFHKILIIEATGESGPHSLDEAKVKIEVKELTQTSEGMWLEYDKGNREKVRSSFRLPGIYIGLTDEYSHATALASKEVAEEQVFGPEKMDFDFMINHRIFPELDAKYHKFHTRSAPVNNTKTQSGLIKEMGEAGLTMAEARKMLSEISGADVGNLDPDDDKNIWLDFPLPIAKTIMSAFARQFFTPDQGNTTDGDDKTAKSMDDISRDFIKGLKDFAKRIRTSE